ncbi:MAG: TIM barrel protein, partial [Candidatus Pacearchaeota archaeon]
MNQIGIMQGRVLPNSVDKLQVFPDKWEEEIKKIKELGFSNIELLDDKFEKLYSLLKNDPKYFLNAFNKNNFKFNSICMDRLCNLSLIKDPVKFISLLKDFISLLPDNNGLVLVVPFFDINKIEKKEDLDFSIKELNKLHSIILKKDIFLSLEIDLNAEIIFESFKLNKSKNIGLCYDLGNNIGKGRDIAKEILLLKNNINHVHVKDKVDNKNVRLRKNNTELKKGFLQLKNINYNGLLILETCITPVPFDEAKTNLDTVKEYLEETKLKALFIGLGSIGQRHLQNLKVVDPDIKLYGLEIVKDFNKVIKDGKMTEVDNFENFYDIKMLNTTQEAKKINPDIVFITNPSALHISTALEFAKIGSNIFIEKPLGNSLDGLAELEKAVREKNLISMIGYQTRFNPLYKESKIYLDQNKDKIVSASFEWGTYMPFHHKYENYVEGYAARKDLGGGAVLGLIHEIDLIYSLFGQPSNIYSIGGNFSDLKMDVEDTVISLMRFNIKGHTFPLSLFLSYAQTKEIRQFKVQFTDSVLITDLHNNSLKIFDIEGKLIKE